MFNPLHLISHAVRVIKTIAYERATKEKRSPHWPTVRKHHLEAHPTCAACGNKKKLQVHHEKPFHTDPKLELEPTNLITLCEAVGKDCHLLYGHGDSFFWYSKTVVADAAEVLAHPERRKEVAARAKAHRTRNEPGGGA